MKIEIKSKRVNFNLEIFGKYSVIAGYSGTGKTTLYKALESVEAGNKAVKVKSNIRIHALAKTEIDLSKYEGCIIIMDEYCLLMREKELATLLSSSNNYFVIISRKKLDFLPLSVDNYYRLVTVGNTTYNEPIFKRFNRFEFKGIQTIVTEDAISGKKFFEDYYSCLTIKSAKGKALLAKYIANNFKDLTNVLIVYDASAFAYQIESLLEVIGNRFCNVLDWESFENYILRCNPFNIILTQKECDCYTESLEQFSTESLSKIIEYSSGKSYSKCLHKLSKCNECNNINICVYKHNAINGDLKINEAFNTKLISVF